ncbi:MAG: hypothetical protein K8W52_44930 [Deltaproteobacteria bacterium]|nr:hypothetical protein [Deltaproteobacteria bacterium]
MIRTAVVALLLTSCAHPLPPMPTAAAPPPVADATLVWVGRGDAYRWRAGTWQRDAGYDYEFSVVQRRYRDHWESIKSLHRRHPDYDGRGGPRDQSMFFRMDLAPEGAGVALAIASNLGRGQGHTDREFRDTELELAASQRGRFVPFDRFHLVQHYRYEQGTLDETVTLSDGAAPFMKNEEHAALFAAETFAAPPTTFQP